MKVTIGTPHLTNKYHSKFGDALVGLMHHSAKNGISINRITTYRDNITFARNKIASKFLESDSDYLLFLDDDMVFKPDLLMNLIEKDKPVVGALTFLRGEPHLPSLYKIASDNLTYNPILMWRPSALEEIDALGMAATLIRRDVFEEMKAISQFHNNIWGFFDNLEFLGEDFRFCRKARDLNIKIHCDTSQLVGHIVDKVIGFKDFKALNEYNALNVRKQIAEKKYGIK